MDESPQGCRSHTIAAGRNDTYYGWRWRHGNITVGFRVSVPTSPHLDADRVGSTHVIMKGARLS